MKTNANRMIAAVAVMALVTGARAMTEEDCTFTATYDGTVQKYLKLTPDNLPPGPVDVIVWLHGHGSDRTQVRHKRGECRSAWDLAEKRGMLIISPDYRATKSWMGPAAEADVLQILGLVKAKHSVAHVYFVGGSMGGTSSLAFAGLHPDLVDGVVAFNPLADHMTYGAFQPAISASFGGTKKEVPDEYRKRSGITHVDKLTMPVSITVGGKDTTIPPASALALAAKLQAAHPGQCYLDSVETRGHATDYAASMKALEEMLNRVYKNTKKD